MNKKLLSLLLALALMGTLTACGGTSEQELPQEELTEQTEQEQTDAPAIEEEPEAETPAEPEAPEPQEEPALDQPATPAGQSSQQPQSQPAQPTPPPAAPTPVQPSTDAGVQSAVLADFYASLAETQTDWPAMMALEGESLDAFYPGLSAIVTRQLTVNTAMISAAVGEIALVEVENAADVQAVKDIFQARINYQVGDDTNPGGAWYPDSIEGWKNDSRIVSNGNYVMLVAFSGADSVVAAFNALA